MGFRLPVHAENIGYRAQKAHCGREKLTLPTRVRQGVEIIELSYRVIDQLLVIDRLSVADWYQRPKLQSLKKRLEILRIHLWSPQVHIYQAVEGVQPS